MFRYSFVFMVVGIISAAIYISDYFAGWLAFSVIPGWHTVLYPRMYLVSLAQAVWLCIMPLIYLSLEKRQAPLRKPAVIAHLSCCLTYYLNFDSGFKYDIISSWWSFVPLLIFVLGQLIFIFHATRML